MKRIVLILGAIVLIIGTYYILPDWTFAQAPTPSPVPSPSPSPVLETIEPWKSSQEVNLYYYFVAAVTNAPFYDLNTRRDYVAPTGWTLYITDVYWSCNSAVNGTLSWSSTAQPFDRVFFPNAGQGKVSQYETPLYSRTASQSPLITTDRASNGAVFISGYLK